MKTLHPNLIQQRWLMLESGEQKEEYREITEYWDVRLFENWKDFKPSAKIILLGIMNRTTLTQNEFKRCLDLELKKFDATEFKNGMKRNGVSAPVFTSIFFFCSLLVCYFYVLVYFASWYFFVVLFIFFFSCSVYVLFFFLAFFL